MGKQLQGTAFVPAGRSLPKRDGLVFLHGEGDDFPMRPQDHLEGLGIAVLPAGMLEGDCGLCAKGDCPELFVRHGRSSLRDRSIMPISALYIRPRPS